LSVEKCHFINVQGLYHRTCKSKKGLIGDVLQETNSLFIAMSETHLDADVLSAEIQIDGYTFYRSDRKLRKCGGVAIYVRNDLGSCVEGTFSNDVCECLIVKLEKIKTIVITCYRPPTCSKELFEELLEFLQSFVYHLNQNVYKIVLNGDFNFPFIHWLEPQTSDESGSYVIGNGLTGSEKKSVRVIHAFGE